MLNQSFAGEPSRAPPLVQEQPPVQDPTRSPSVPVASAKTPFQALAAAAVNGQSPVICNPQHRGLSVFVNLTAVTGTTPSIAFTINAVDPISSALVPMLTGTALTANGSQLLQIYPGIAVAAGQAANAVLPSQIVITWAITGTTPAFTGTVTPVLQP